MLDLQRLRMLREVHRLGTLARAADSMAYTPSAISHQLSLLEKEAGVVLLERVGRGVRLTPEAVTLVRHTEEMLAQMERAEADLAGAQTTVGGTIRIGAFQTAVMAAASTALDYLEQAHPQLTVEITEQEVTAAYEGLVSHDVDMIIGEEYPGLAEPVRPGVERVDLIRDPMYLVIPTTGPFSDIPETFRDLADCPWAMDPDDQPTGLWVRALCRHAGFEPRVRFNTHNPLIQSNLVAAGHAVAVIPALLGDHAAAGTRLIGLPGNGYRMVYTSVRTGRENHPAVRACREAFEAAVHREASPDPELRLSR